MDPPARRGAPPPIRETPFQRGDKTYIRRDYLGGTVDLICRGARRGEWVYEIYERTDIPAMNYDFEFCLASPRFCLRYLRKIAVYLPRSRGQE